MEPGLAGKAFYDKILARDPEQARRIVFLTGGTFASDIVDFLNSIPNRRIGKPCDTKDLRRLVNELMAEMGPIAGPAAATNAPLLATSR
jgi:hypothetical protein